VTRPGETIRRPLPRAIETSLPVFLPVVHFTAIAEDFADAFEETDIAADRCNYEGNFFAALEWIVSRRRTGRKNRSNREDSGSAEDGNDGGTAGFGVVKDGSRRRHCYLHRGLR
jgi:hypothetical protein